MGSLPDHDIRLTEAQLAQLAEWAHYGPDAAHIELRLDLESHVLIVGQGDDQAAWDTAGQPVEDEQLAVALAPKPISPWLLVICTRWADTDSLHATWGSALDALAGYCRNLARRREVAGEIARIWSEVPDDQALDETRAFELAENAVELGRLVQQLDEWHSRTLGEIRSARQSARRSPSCAPGTTTKSAA